LRAPDGAEGTVLTGRNLVCAAAACAALLAFAAFPAFARSAAPQKMPDDYARAATRVTISPGRQLNLRCAGHGARTVVLEAGSHADSSTWFRVQPLLASFARVCAYDRAGYGFSDAGPLPRNLDADVHDLHALIHRAGIATPVVLVGHSLGSNIARRDAELHPADVAAMVLIDPPAQDIAAFAPGWQRDESELGKQRFAFIRACDAAAEKGMLATKPPPGLEKCLAGDNPLADAQVNAATRTWKSRPGFWRTLLSELQDNTRVFAAPVSDRESHGAVPLLVLSASDSYPDAPAELRSALESARAKTQADIVATSSRGRLIRVQHTSHDIQLDQPEAVVDAVRQVLRQVAAPEH
jgi:pimeloyl-ACP methyl ester carboxylesterase